MDSSKGVMKAAFDAWWKETDGVRSRNNDYEAWQAACKWQRERDVRICEEVAERTFPDKDYTFAARNAANHCANFVLFGYVIKD